MPIVGGVDLSICSELEVVVLEGDVFMVGGDADAGRVAAGIRHGEGAWTFGCERSVRELNSAKGLERWVTRSGVYLAPTVVIMPEVCKCQSNASREVGLVKKRVKQGGQM